MNKQNSSNSSNTSLYLVLLFAVLIGFCFGRFIINWKLHYSPEMADLIERKELVIAEINKGQTLRAREKEFDAEVQRLKKELSDLYVQLPLSMEIDPFMRVFQDHMNQIRIKVNDYQSEITTREDNLYSQCRTTIILSSPIPADEEFDFDRLLKWENRDKDNPKVTFFIFSSNKHLKYSAQTNPCAGLENSKVIWPFSKNVDELRADLEVYCRQYVSLEPYIRKVNVLEKLRNDIVYRSKIIEEINGVVKTPFILSAPNSE